MQEAHLGRRQFMSGAASAAAALGVLSVPGYAGAAATDKTAAAYELPAAKPAVLPQVDVFKAFKAQPATHHKHWEMGRPMSEQEYQSCTKLEVPGLPNGGTNLTEQQWLHLAANAAQRCLLMSEPQRDCHLSYIQHRHPALFVLVKSHLEDLQAAAREHQDFPKELCADFLSIEALHGIRLGPCNPNQERPGDCDVIFVRPKIIRLPTDHPEQLAAMQEQLVELANKVDQHLRLHRNQYLELSSPAVRIDDCMWEAGFAEPVAAMMVVHTYLLRKPDFGHYTG